MASSARDFWYVVSWASSVANTPKSAELLGERIVLWRNKDGMVSAAIDRCPHRGTQLSLGTVDEDGCLVCPYHGWAFEPSGRCVAVPQFEPSTPIPARVRLETIHCQEQSGMVWVCLGNPVVPIGSFPEWDESGYRHVECEPYTWECSPERMVENFMDFGHLGYLHDGLLGSRDDLTVPDHHVTTVASQLFFELTMMVPDATDSFAVTKILGDRGKQTNTYVVTAPYTIYLQSHYHDTGVNRTLFFSVQPNSEGRSTGYCFQSRDFDLHARDEPFAAFQSLLAEQDRPIVESQLPIAAPLVLKDEVHLSFDKVAIAYRRLLRAYLEAPKEPEMLEADTVKIDDLAEEKHGNFG